MNKPRRRTPTPYQLQRRLQGKILTWLLLGVIVVFVGLSIVQKDREFSDSENRKLAQVPGVADLKDGTFLKDLGTYMADQFPFRDGWISLNFKMNTLLGQKEANGVYLCKNDTLMQIPAEPNYTQRERNLAAMDSFAAAYPDVKMYAAVVPNAVTINPELLPKNAPVRDQMADLSAIQAGLHKVSFLDVTPTLLSHKDESLYYRTDHHWTSRAAFYAFQSMAPAMNLLVPGEEGFTVFPVSNTFEGTLASKSGSHKAKDTVEIYVPLSNIDYYVTYADSGK